jgi:hypothetical protein
MLCYCGQEIGSTNSYGWQICRYNEHGEVIYAVCMHGIVCIDIENNILRHIETLEDLIISIENEIVGYEPCGREQQRLESLKFAIETLRKNIT